MCKKKCTKRNCFILKEMDFDQLFRGIKNQNIVEDSIIIDFHSYRHSILEFVYEASLKGIHIVISNPQNLYPKLHFREYKQKLKHLTDNGMSYTFQNFHLFRNDSILRLFFVALHYRILFRVKIESIKFHQARKLKIKNNITIIDPNTWTEDMLLQKTNI